MFVEVFAFFERFENVLWGYIGVPLLMTLGFYLSIHSNFFQVRKLPYAIKRFIQLTRIREYDERGVHPLKAFFACVGGCVGVGNVVGVCTAIQLGGPGALFWVWITALAGMIIKYSEVYLGLRYRVPNSTGGYNGGPMYYLQRVFKTSLMPKVVCLLLCVYGVEVYQFSVVTESISTNLSINQYVVIFVLLSSILFASSGGVRRVANISTLVIPVFVILYVAMGLWVLGNNWAAIPHAFKMVFDSAFTNAAAFGGFVGSTLMFSISQGVRRGCYTGDLGVGYAAVIHSESNAKVPEQQASLALLEIFIDTFVICTPGMMMALVTDVWHQPLGPTMMVQTALGLYFPYMEFFMPLFLFVLGYSTINAYFCVGLKCAEFVSPRFGRRVYYFYGIMALLTCSFVGVSQAQTVMTIANGLLLMINCYGVFRLRHEISYTLPTEIEEETVNVEMRPEAA